MKKLILIILGKFKRKQPNEFRSIVLKGFGGVASGYVCPKCHVMQDQRYGCRFC